MVDDALPNLLSAPPPLRSQEEVINRFAPLLKNEGKICRKTVSSFIRRAVEGEHVVTTIDGIQETEQTVKNDNSWVVCGKAAGEFYVISENEFQESYDTESAKPMSPAAGSSDPRSKRLRQQGFMKYRSTRQVRGRKVDEHDMNFFRHGNESKTMDTAAYYVAPWGESMRVEQGDFLVMQYPRGNDDIYRVECAAFEYSYADDSLLGSQEKEEKRVG